MKLITLLLPYSIALILTLIIEGILCWLFLKSRAWVRFTCLVNLFTNPLLNFVYSIAYQKLTTAPWFLLLLEGIVWFSEALLFYLFAKQNQHKKMTAKNSNSSIYKALLFSIVLNAASFLIGLLLQL